VRICIVYDCLFPWTIGGAERWYRNLGETLAAQGHRVTYLTLRQWDEPPQIDGVSVIAVAPRMELYRNGKRRLLPPLRFGVGVLLHLMRHGRSYDVVHTASFPYFSLLAAGLVRILGGYRISCDWHEVWSSDYWREYLGPLGRIGQFIQALCARVPQKAYTFSRLHKNRVEGLGVRSVTQLPGLCVSQSERPLSYEGERTSVVYAGRFIPEKRIELLVDAIDVARKSCPDLQAHLIGDGPTRPEIMAKIQAKGLSGAISCPGFVSSDALDEAMGSALCVVQPSRREGYGMIVAEAAHRGIPILVVAAPDNASTELVVDGQNGFVVQSAEPEMLGKAILKCKRQGAQLRESTSRWYAEHRHRLSMESSLAVIAEEYHGGVVPLSTKAPSVTYA